jgi:ribA/ribD-fused uncharacterized protein
MPHGLDTDTHVYFYEQEFYVLSNFSAFQVRWKNKIFQTSEHLYQFLKFDYAAGTMETWAKAIDVKNTIRLAPSAHEAFKIAEANAIFHRPDWLDVRVPIMKQILLAKVEQHEYVKYKLLQTGSKILEENSWRDDFWGTGPNGDGLNMLGKLWMEIREEITSDSLYQPVTS